jgi:predicted DCC family thiol-disulfide oxidoreductase YuxK
MMVFAYDGYCSLLCKKYVEGIIDALEWERRQHAAIQQGAIQEGRKEISESSSIS